MCSKGCLGRFPSSETVAIAMQTHEDDCELGPIAEALDVACCELRRMYGAVDLAPHIASVLSRR